MNQQLLNLMALIELGLKHTTNTKDQTRLIRDLAQMAISTIEYEAEVLRLNQKPADQSGIGSIVRRNDKARVSSAR